MPASTPRSTVLAPTLLAAALAAVYLIWAPSSQDLAAATFRADLFADHGFAIWNNAWYAGHYLLSYSVLYPPLGRLARPAADRGAGRGRGGGAVRAPGAAAIRRRRRCVPSLWFAAAIGVWLLTGRIPFLLAVPFGLGALLAADSSRLLAAALLAALASLASPVAGLFVALAGAAIALAGERGRGLALAARRRGPDRGAQPRLPDRRLRAVRVLRLHRDPAARPSSCSGWSRPSTGRCGSAPSSTPLLALALFVIDNPLGGNVTRLGALFAGPVLALVLWPRGRWVVIAVSIPLLYWQLIAPVRDVAQGVAGDPSTERAFYEPLLAELDRLAAARESFRIEIPPTKNRWEAAYVAREHPIARGWLRQLESDDFDLFTDGNLTADAYRDWLDEHAVSYVAVPDARRDYLAEDEVALIDSGPRLPGRDLERRTTGACTASTTRLRSGRGRAEPDSFTLDAADARAPTRRRSTSTATGG